MLQKAKCSMGGQSDRCPLSRNGAHYLVTLHVIYIHIYLTRKAIQCVLGFKCCGFELVWMIVKPRDLQPHSFKDFVAVHRFHRPRCDSSVATRFWQVGINVFLTLALCKRCVSPYMCPLPKYVVLTVLELLIGEIRILNGQPCHSSVSTFTCSKKFEFLIVSDNDMRRTGSLVWVYMPFRESDNWPEHGWLRYARWRCSPLNKEPHPVDLYLFFTIFLKRSAFLVFQLSINFNIFSSCTWVSMNRVSSSVQKCVAAEAMVSIDWAFPATTPLVCVRRLLSLPGEGPGINSQACAECIIRFRSDSWVYMALKKPTTNKLSRCSYPISRCPIWSEVGPK